MLEKDYMTRDKNNYNLRVEIFKDGIEYIVIIYKFVNAPIKKLYSNIYPNSITPDYIPNHSSLITIYCDTELLDEHVYILGDSKYILDYMTKNKDKGVGSTCYRILDKEEIVNILTVTITIINVVLSKRFSTLSEYLIVPIEKELFNFD